MAERLTNKREAFLLGIIEGKSQRAAYKAAFNTSGMKDETIDQCACRLLKVPKVAARYEELLGKVREEAEKGAVATALEVLGELSDIGMGRKCFPVYDMFGNPHSQKPTVPSRIKALELLGKHFGMFEDNVHVTGDVGVQVVDDIPDGNDSAD